MWLATLFLRSAGSSVNPAQTHPTVTGKRVADTSALVNQDKQAFEEVYQEYVEQLTNSEPPKPLIATRLLPLRLHNRFWGYSISNE